MSHRDQEGHSHKAIGYWGVTEKCQPVQAPSNSIPTWLNRNKLGTSLYILGFEEIDDWELMLAASIAQNFFGSISAGKLEVKVGSTVLNADSLSTFFDSADDLKTALLNQKEPEEFREAGLFHKTLNPKGVFVESTQHQILGNCELRIWVAEKLPKKVAILRDGMFITAELPRLKRFADFKDFVAIFQCKSEQGNKLLRAMEPPRHDDFEPQRLDPSDQEKAKRALTYIGTWVRDMLKRHARNPVSEETTIDELSEYFSDEDPEGGNRTSKSGDVNPKGKLLISARPMRHSPKVEQYTSSDEFGLEESDDEEDTFEAGESIGDNTDIGSTEGRKNGGSGGGSDKDNANDKSEGKGSGDKNKSGYGTGKSIILENVRAIPISPSRRRLSFETKVNGEIAIRLQVAGADANEFLSVVKADVGEVRSGLVYSVPVESGKRTFVEVDLEQTFTGAIRISAHAL